jgi:hypothetical protein
MIAAGQVTETPLRLIPFPRIKRSELSILESFISLIRGKTLIIAQVPCSYSVPY